MSDNPIRTFSILLSHVELKPKALLVATLVAVLGTVAVSEPVRAIALPEPILELGPGTQSEEREVEAEEEVELEEEE